MAEHVSPPAPLFVIGSFVAACSVRVDRLPDPGESVRASSFLLEPGGKGFNVAVAARRLGIAVDGLFAVGRDPLGAIAGEAFVAAGLDRALIVTVPGGTGGGAGLIEAAGEARIAVCPGANDLLDGEHLDAAAARLRKARLAYAQFESPDAAIARGFAIARGARVATMLNPSPMRAIAPGLLALTDILAMDRTEADMLAVQAGLPIPARSDDWIGTYAPLAAWCADRGVATLIVTLGADGACCWHRGACHARAGFAVVAIDGIGAGDAFAAAWIAAWLAGDGSPMCLDACLTAGCAAGAIVAARRGVLDALPDAAGLARFIAART